MLIEWGGGGGGGGGGGDTKVLCHRGEAPPTSTGGEEV